jgi:hypothetical protein
VLPVVRRHERIGPHRFTTTDLTTGVVQEFDVDRYGLVHDLTDAFRRR